ncbi:sulfotransferase domain-containing protein [Sinobacterium caligoides]|uniref:Sulfotransferase domain-containing protein n=1 Tax=Sinobacterium caligoides TaxID=933926 RepID=A0A3N2DXS4_9GAMM|nr:sulfotransferase domain-containing protein [Sinobacterium caligoides]ROS04618.1 sulfotransferase domain-containing protein [Sinobacterium caligoides]
MEQPNNIEGFIAALDSYLPEGAGDRAEQYQPDSSDVFIATYPKSGTTWMQQIVHSLRSNGDMSFDDISTIVPYLEGGDQMVPDLYQPQVARPHAFKTHFHAERLPEGGRYIFTTRDPYDVAMSYHQYMEGWFFQQGSISMEEFALEYMFDDPHLEHYWHHLASWIKRREEENVLFMAYENNCKDFSGAVNRVARFIGVDDEASINTAIKNSSFEFMKQHAGKFDERTMQLVYGQQPDQATSGKIHQGKSGKGEAFGEAVKRAFDARWAEYIKPLGYDDYEALLASC